MTDEQLHRLAEFLKDQIGMEDAYDPVSIIEVALRFVAGKSLSSDDAKAISAAVGDIGAKTVSKLSSTAIIYHDDGSEAARIWCADGFVSRCVTSIAQDNIPDAIAAAKVLNADAATPIALLEAENDRLRKELRASEDEAAVRLGLVRAWRQIADEAGDAKLVAFIDATIAPKAAA